MDLVGKSLVLVRVSTKDYFFFFVVFTPVFCAFFVEFSVLIHTPTTSLDRNKGVANCIPICGADHSSGVPRR